MMGNLTIREKKHWSGQNKRIGEKHVRINKSEEDRCREYI